MKKRSSEISRVLLVEVAGSHDECLYTQIAALEEREISYLIATDKDVAQRLRTSRDCIRIVRTGEESSWRIATNIRRLMREYRPEKVVFNTAQGSIVRNVALMSLGSSAELFGIIHTNRKFQGSFTQKLINLSIKKYYFLAGFLEERIRAPRGIKTTYFYPLDFPLVVDAPDAIDPKHIVVIGGVESRRKDLQGFLTMIQDERLKDHTFSFLGKSDEKNNEVVKFKQELREIKKEDHVKLYPDFVTHELFAAELAKAAFVLPLIHPGTSSSEQYFSNQIPGAMNVALAAKRPLLLHEDYKWIKELEPAAIYYNLSNFGEVILAMDALSYDKKRTGMREQMAYSQEHNRKRFMRFLLDENS